MNWATGQTGESAQAPTLDEREDAYLVGRERERALFEQFLNGDSGLKRIWSLYGTGGVGKSTLLDAFRRQARRRGAAFFLLDSREFGRTGESFCRKLLELMPNGKEKGIEKENGETLTEQVLGGLSKLAEERPVVVAVDTFEELSHLEGWLLDEFLRGLHPDVLIVAAGRHPLKGRWMLSPAWRERTLWLSLGHLQRTEVLEYARKCGITDADQGERLWERTQGHGLSLALAVSAELMGNGGPLDQQGWSAELASLWLREVPDEELLVLVEAASMLRLFNQELLEYITGQDVGMVAFAKLTELSFVRKSGKGWRMHDLMRDSTRGHLRERSPARFARLMKRCVLYYVTVIRESYRKRDVADEVGELFYYIGNEVMRAFLNGPDRGDYEWEPLTAANLEEGRHYLERRHNEARSFTRRGIDPVTGELMEQGMSEVESLYAIAELDLEELLALGRQSVMLMKAQDGTVCGLSAIIPIHSDTISYLERNPFSGPYIRSLTLDERKALEVKGPDPSGWFIRSIDVLDWEDTSMLLEAVSRMYTYMCAGKLFFATPPPLDIHRQSHLGLGFELLSHASHCSYDGKTPTPTFVLDTRGDKLEAFLAAMLGRVGLDREELSPTEGNGAGRKSMSDQAESERRFETEGLTEREREVVLLVLEGCSNAEIAARLFVSEITVKKHLSSVYAKMQVKNRSQLIKAILQ
ncbi:LuxR C-terminal-related transcriptional regulator [Paenibacillus chartarius]|uniref:LuxR C-terminal-related transcriptional regulator n=1 Tax=Paenibacillus chartarius TaxID=747481 RepID=A0ABV6DQU8_9BACL